MGDKGSSAPRVQWPSLREKLSGSKLARVLSYSDFRLMWLGAFVSFTGSWVQNVAQGYFVFELTKQESKLALVNFCSSAPVFLLGFLAGSLADMFDKRRVLIMCQAVFAAGALYLGVATKFEFVQYWQIVAVALILGTVGTIEMPTRQSIVSRVVPIEDLAAAVPVNAMTFNTARIFGPAIGGIILSRFGVSACYFTNGITYLALIYAVAAIRSDLTARTREPQPIKDLILEGMTYTWRDIRLRTLFILESITATCGIFYIPLMPAYVKQVLGLGMATVVQNGKPVEVDLAKQGLGYAFTAVGIGALLGLLLAIHLSDSQHKSKVIRGAMIAMGVGLLLLGSVREPVLAYPLLAILGAGSIMQFNTTNALFQILSPEQLRGRVLSMHIWALNGLSPFGVLFFGWLANASREGALASELPWTGVELVYKIGGVLMILGAIGALFSKRGLKGLERTEGASA